MTHQQSTEARGGSTRELPLPGPVGAPGGITGGFQFRLSDGTWWWSPGMYMLLGIDQRQINQHPPSTRLLLRHLHPADRATVGEAWLHLRERGGPVAFDYRITGADGVLRPVFVTASVDRDSNGGVISGVIALETAPIPAQRSHRE